MSSLEERGRISNPSPGDEMSSLEERGRISNPSPGDEMSSLEERGRISNPSPGDEMLSLEERGRISNPSPGDEMLSLEERGRISNPSPGDVRELQSTTLIISLTCGLLWGPPLVNPDFSPGRLLLPETCLLSIDCGSILTFSTLQTALDAPLLVFFAPVGTCSLNQSYGYAFGRRHLLAQKIRRKHRITW